MEYEMTFRPNLSPVPIQPSESLYNLHPSCTKEDIAQLYLSEPLNGLIRFWAVAWNDNAVVNDSISFVNEDVANILRDLHGKLLPLIRSELPEWIHLSGQPGMHPETD